MPNSDPFDEAGSEAHEARLIREIQSQSKPRFRIKKIGSAMRRTVARHGLSEQQIASVRDGLWEEAVGATLAETSQPGKLSRGKLLIRVDDNATLQELTFMKSRILRTLQKSPDLAAVRDLKFFVDH